MKLREWQKNVLEAFVERRNKNKHNTFVFEACPGAGKSHMASELAWQMVNDDDQSIDLVIVVVPWNSIRGDETAGMIKAFDTRGLRIRDRLMLRGARIVQQPVPSAFDAIITTYAEAMTQEGVETIQLWRSKGLRIAFVFDEIHHASQLNGQWGSFAEEAHESSAMTIVMSGTYFRTDQHPIKFVEYDADGRPITHCPPYRYAQGVADRVVRPVAFRYFDAELKCIDEREGLETHSISSIAENDRRFGAVMREVFHPEGDVMRHMIHKIDEHLTQTRRVFCNAGALITCRPGRDGNSEDKHVKQIAQKVRQYTGEDAVIVTHADKNAQGKISAFRNGTSRYLIAVNMITEGVDIPRLRAVGFMRYVSSEMMFRQIVGRVLRMTEHEDGTAAMGFMPKFDVMERFALNMEGEAIEGMRDLRCEKCFQYPCVCTCEECGQRPCVCVGPPPPHPPPRPDFDVLEAIVKDAGGSVSEDQVTEAWVTIAKAVQQRSPHHAHSNTVQLAHALQLGFPMQSADTHKGEDSDTPLMRLNAARKRVNRLINKLAGKVYGGDFKDCWVQEVMKPTGKDWNTIKNTWTSHELEQLANRLEERLVAAFKNGNH